MIRRTVRDFGRAGIPACQVWCGNMDQISVTRRKLPHWTLDGSLYFVTFRTNRGELSIQERAVVMEHLVSGDPKYYELIAAVVMPDHVHMLIKPKEGVTLSRIMKGIKGVSARKINIIRQTRMSGPPTGMSGPPEEISGLINDSTVWQDESFDRIVRDQEEFVEKLCYMYHNPVKKGLAQDPASYPGWYRKKNGGAGIPACHKSNA